jgi:hypothetical protein
MEITNSLDVLFYTSLGHGETEAVDLISLLLYALLNLTVFHSTYGFSVSLCLRNFVTNY